MLLNTVRCEICAVELVEKSLNTTLWAAQQAGWFVAVDGGDIDKAFCPEHRGNPEYGPNGQPLPPQSERWEVWCNTCDWETAVWSKNEAEDEKRQHNCDDWREDWPDVDIRSPKEIAESAQRIAQYHERRRAEQAEQQRAEQEQEALTTAGRQYLELRGRYGWLFWAVDILEQTRSSRIVERLLRYTQH